MLNPASSSTEVIEPSRVCGAPFYVYAGPNNNVLVEAPGFVVKSGRFKNMVVPRLKPSSIPERVVKVGVGDEAERAAGVIRVGRGGIELSLTRSLGAPRLGRVMYNEELGVYRVVEEYVEKPRARGARLEICSQTPGPKTCST